MIPEFLFIAAAFVVGLAALAVLRQDKSAFAANLRARIEALQIHLKQREAVLEGTGKLQARYLFLKEACHELGRKETRLKEDIDALQPRASEVETQLKSLTEEKSKLQSELSGLEENRRKWEDRIKELDRLDEVKGDTIEQQKQLDEQIKETEEKILKLADQLKEAQEAEAKLSELMEQLAEVEKSKLEFEKEMEGLRNEKTEIEEALEKSKTELEDLERSKKMLESIQLVGDGTGGASGAAESRLTKETFRTLYEPEFHNSEALHEENLDDSLDDFHRHLQKHGYLFSERLVNAFHTSLKVQDVSCLTVMAGISGTGKSALPRLYADYMGIHFLLVPVEPRWDSPQDLFGFLNYMENRYEATPLGRALMQFNQKDTSEQEPMQDEMLLVLLDEMNLARVEYYFSEFLSRLEARREVNWRNNTSAYQKVSMEIFAGEKDEDEKRVNPIRLFAGPNVLFVGTMNEDESTQSLTDKVIDRSNTIHFGRPENLKARQGKAIAAKIEKVSYSSWVNNRAAGLRAESSAGKVVDAYLKNLNTAFDRIGRPFGHRTYAATCAYIANHPDGLSDEISDMRSLADQIAMRYLPKLRGLDLQEHQGGISELRTLIAQLEDEAVRKAFDKASDLKNGYFMWRGIDWQ